MRGDDLVVAGQLAGRGVLEGASTSSSLASCTGSAEAGGENRDRHAGRDHDREHGSFSDTVQREQVDYSEDRPGEFCADRERSRERKEAERHDAGSPDVLVGPVSG